MKYLIKKNELYKNCYRNFLLGINFSVLYKKLLKLKTYIIK